MNHFFNTTGEDLPHFHSTAIAQENEILEMLYAKDVKGGFSSLQVYEWMECRILETSVRRSLTLLCAGGYIYDTGYRKRGNRGRKLIVWKLTKDR